MVKTTISKHLALLVFTLLLLQCKCQDLPECIKMDPGDPESIAEWKVCGSGGQEFSFVKYSDLDIPPHDSEATAALMNSGPGVFCIESEFATTKSDEFYSEFVYRIVTGGNIEPTFYFALLDELDTFLVQYYLKDIGVWQILPDWLLEVGNYKLRIYAEVGEGETVMVESIFATDLTSTQPECVIQPEPEPEPEPPVTDPTTVTVPTETTTEWATDTTTDLTDPTDTTTNLPTEPTTQDPTETTADSTITTDTTWTTETTDATTLTDTTDITITSTETTTELSSEPTTQPPIIDPPTVPPVQPGEDAESNEEMWMVIAIVFISLFALLVLFTVFKFFLPKYRAAQQMKSVPLRNPYNQPMAPIQTTPVTKIPRLYVDSIHGRPVITAQQKTA